jgi:site-specific recombinase XerD
MVLILSLIRHQKKGREIPMPLTKHEVEQLLSRIDNLKDYTLLLFGFSSGVRVGELAFDYNSINWRKATFRYGMKRKTGIGKCMFLITF